MYRVAGGWGQARLEVEQGGQAPAGDGAVGEGLGEQFLAFRLDGAAPQQVEPRHQSSLLEGQHVLQDHEIVAEVGVTDPHQLVAALQVVVGLAHRQLESAQAVGVAVAGLLQSGPGLLHGGSAGKVHQGISQFQPGCDAAVALVQVGVGPAGDIERAAGGEGAAKTQDRVALRHAKAGAALVIAKPRQGLNLGPIPAQPCLKIGQRPGHLQPLLLELRAVDVGHSQRLREA